MQRLHLYLGSFLLSAALIVPVGVQAKNHCPDQNGKKGYYDNGHKDCHYWDDREDHTYQTWWEAQGHKTHREWSKLKAKERSEYWKWRHEHPDNDQERH
ncbi:MAG TPA: hypothetical protein VGQ94_00565 [Terriglobales bacterium]|nr:hypothetical protein [Terriglobales bacterium]